MVTFHVVTHTMNSNKMKNNFVKRNMILVYKFDVKNKYYMYEWDVSHFR